MSIISIQGPRFQFIAYLIIFLSSILYIVAIFNLLSLELSIQYISTRPYSKDSYRFSTSLKYSYIASSLLPFKIERIQKQKETTVFTNLERFSLFSSFKLVTKLQRLEIVAVSLAIRGTLQQSFRARTRARTSC